MTQNPVWAEVSCDVPTAAVDSLAEFLVELSGGGVSIENLSVDTFSADTIEDSPVKSVKAYLPDDGELEGKITEITGFLASIAPTYPGFIPEPPSVSFLREEDWANNWKAHFKPSRIGSRLVIKPTWEDYTPATGDIVIELDPGMAFGTGTHATTQLCLEAIERIFFREPPYDLQQPLTPRNIFDVGTGSGVLAIAAAKMGAREVTGIDIDPVAVEVANENLVLNHVEDMIRITTEPLEGVVGIFDIVVANILAEELVRLRTELVSRLAGGGILILSGILTEKEELVLNGFSTPLLSLVEITRSSEWSCLSYRREA
jgi:ribosomal protein L11 methyltransferase